MRIFTGGVMPKGADTVVMQERATEIAGAVRIGAHAVSKTGQFRRFAGEELKRGDRVFERGQPLRAAELGMLASLGLNEVSVYRRLRVAFFSTGDELRSLGQPLGAGEIYDSNRYTLYAMLTRMDCEVVDLGVVRDDPEALESAFASASACADVVISSGGVSVGEADYVKRILDKLGEVLFWKIAMKPGRPLAYGRIAGAHFFGLPGNPVAVMVTFYQFVRVALHALQGRRVTHALPAFNARLAAPIRKMPGRSEFQRVSGNPILTGVSSPQHRRPRFGHPVVDVASQLLHRAAGGGGRPPRRHRGRGAAVRRPALSAQAATGAKGAPEPEGPPRTPRAQQ